IADPTAGFADPTLFTRSNQSLHNFRGGDDLPDVALGVLGGVDEEAEDGRGELQATDSSRFEEGRFRGRAELREGAVDLGLEGLGERGGLSRRFSGVGLARQEGPVLRGGGTTGAPWTAHRRIGARPQPPGAGRAPRAAGRVRGPERGRGARPRGDRRRAPHLAPWSTSRWRFRALTSFSDGSG